MSFLGRRSKTFGRSAAANLRCCLMLGRMLVESALFQLTRFDVENALGGPTPPMGMASMTVMMMMTMMMMSELVNKTWTLKVKRWLPCRNANKHCKRRTCQGIKLANEKMAKAMGDKMSDVPHASIASCSQNLDLLHFGGEQPGETLHCSPLNVFQFRVVDPADNDELHAFVCNRKKGGGQCCFTGCQSC